MSSGPLILWFPEIRRSQVGTVGGKNASLGELIGRLRDAGIRIQEGFSTTAEALRLTRRHDQMMVEPPPGVLEVGGALPGQRPGDHVVTETVQTCRRSVDRE